MLTSKNIKVPKINNDLQDYVKLFDLWNSVNKENLRVYFDFSDCGFLADNGVAFLGGLVSLIRFNGGDVRIDTTTIKEDVLTNLKQNNFLNHCGLIYGPWDGNSIPLRHDQACQSKDYIFYLRTKWLGKGWLQCSDRLINVIIQRVNEIYENAFEHSNSPIGTFSCGQYYPNKGELRLTVVDFGIGIPQKVRGFRESPTMETSSTLKWAFRPGTTTNPTKEIGRGLGLDILREFVTINGGHLQIFSNDGYVSIGRGTTIDVFTRLPRNNFQGTVVNITLKCDESVYALAEEQEINF